MTDLSAIDVLAEARQVCADSMTNPVSKNACLSGEWDHHRRTQIAVAAIHRGIAIERARVRELKQ